MNATGTHELEPIAPSEAKELYHRQREGDVSDRTLQAHHYRLKHFIRWCEDVAGLENLNNLTGRKMQEFSVWRREDGDLNNVSLKTQLQTLRVFIKFCESIDAVPKDLHEKILMPSTSKEDEQSQEILRSEQAGEVLDYLQKFNYGSREHVLLELIWHTGMRVGAVHSLDVDDYCSDEEYLEVHHRPENETPLKNGTEGERLVALAPRVCEILDDWIEQQRPDVTDEDGREPLFTSSNGRLGVSTIRENLYKITRPCFYGQECPHGRDPESCAGTDYGYYSKCPSSVSPHAVRRGSITHHLSEDVPEKVVSDRMNVGPDVLDKHYDKRSEEQKVEQRRGYLDDI